MATSKKKPTRKPDLLAELQRISGLSGRTQALRRLQHNYQWTVEELSRLFEPALEYYVAQGEAYAMSDHYASLQAYQHELEQQFREACMKAKKHAEEAEAMRSALATMSGTQVALNRLIEVHHRHVTTPQSLHEGLQTPTKCHVETNAEPSSKD